MGSPTLDPLIPLPRRKKTLRVSLPLSLLILVAVLLSAQFLLLPALLSHRPLPHALALSHAQQERLVAGLRKCAALHTPPVEYPLPVSSSSRENPRWNPSSGQDGDVILRNATLFDGEAFLPGTVDIKFSKGIVVSISPSSSPARDEEDPNIKTIPLDGKYVTPGLVDMHSHHLVLAWPDLPPSSDVNEIHRDTSGPLTPFVRSRDGMKASDIATTLIASGGITSSLILPGSANVMGGEAYPVKNVLNSGETGEERIEDLLLEKGVPDEQRRRFMKMACGENPKRVYGHTRMGNAWVFRHQMERARELVGRQDEWCLAAAAAQESGDGDAIAGLVSASVSGERAGGLPEELELESSVAILRGQVGVNIHCYEPEDFEDMILHSKEFGFRIQAFHHALSAWKVPEMIKESGENITIATFATHGLYKKEAYDANLWAGKILSGHGLPVAYKSDHSEQSMNAQYLLFQAATAHSFHLPEALALQSVTSVPAKSLGLEHRIGFVRPGYDADIVVFDSHPLSIGATPLQVYIDGRPTLDEDTVHKSLEKVLPERLQAKPQMRPKLDPEVKLETCRRVKKEKTVITGITKSYLQSNDGLSPSSSAQGNLTLVLDKGKLLCLDTASNCISHSTGSSFTLALQNGHLLPGLTAAVTSAGMIEIEMEDRTGDGKINPRLDPLDPESVVFAKYGVRLDGRAFERARIGGVTRVVTAPLGRGFLGGVSVGIKTGGERTLVNGGVFSEDVALHFTLGEGSKGSESTPTISSAVAKLRKILAENKGKDNVYGRASNGSLPLVVHADNKDAILQLVQIKESFPSVNLIVYGASEAASISNILSTSPRIPLILTPRAAPTTFSTRQTPPSPPLSSSPLNTLLSPNATLALGSPGDAALHSLASEASWAGKLAGLSLGESLALVSSNLESILGLPPSEEVVLWEGDPGEFGAGVVLVLEEGGGVGALGCWPESE